MEDDMRVRPVFAPAQDRLQNSVYFRNLHMVAAHASWTAYTRRATADNFYDVAAALILVLELFQQLFKPQFTAAKTVGLLRCAGGASSRKLSQALAEIKGLLLMSRCQRLLDERGAGWANFHFISSTFHDTVVHEDWINADVVRPSAGDRALSAIRSVKGTIHAERLNPEAFYVLTLDNTAVWIRTLLVPAGLAPDTPSSWEIVLIAHCLPRRSRFRHSFGDPGDMIEYNFGEVPDVFTLTLDFSVNWRGQEQAAVGPHPVPALDPGLPQQPEPVPNVVVPRPEPAHSERAASHSGPPSKARRSANRLRAGHLGRDGSALEGHSPSRRRTVRQARVPTSPDTPQRAGGGRAATGPSSSIPSVLQDEMDPDPEDKMDLDPVNEMDLDPVPALDPGLPRQPEPVPRMVVPKTEPAQSEARLPTPPDTPQRAGGGRAATGPSSSIPSALQDEMDPDPEDEMDPDPEDEMDPDPENEMDLDPVPALDPGLPRQPEPVPRMVVPKTEPAQSEARLPTPPDTPQRAGGGRAATRPGSSILSASQDEMDRDRERADAMNRDEDSAGDMDRQGETEFDRQSGSSFHPDGSDSSDSSSSSFRRLSVSRSPTQSLSSSLSPSRHGSSDAWTSSGSIRGSTDTDTDDDDEPAAQWSRPPVPPGRKTTQEWLSAVSIYMDVRAHLAHKKFPDDAKRLTQARMIASRNNVEWTLLPTDEASRVLLMDGGQRHRMMLLLRDFLRGKCQLDDVWAGMEERWPEIEIERWNQAYHVDARAMVQTMLENRLLGKIRQRQINRFEELQCRTGVPVLESPFPASLFVPFPDTTNNTPNDGNGTGNAPTTVAGMSPSDLVQIFMTLQGAPWKAGQSSCTKDARPRSQQSSAGVDLSPTYG
ncbi:hypothetical protein AURDEDRAFT_177356 [Auricularia subglabra TFB-10046 SS5]|uniref:Uncharacterized protein n=1 Tax=Auricularia subglabra (strain TFB-10046 / SS5) TaxID=717982 RepID=J0D4B8_AURST|nr:hypothetical protein AURDEDRAFT_177356 [Auricularia subglabra TFB-10046 SS5]